MARIWGDSAWGEKVLIWLGRGLLVKRTVRAGRGAGLVRWASGPGWLPTRGLWTAGPRWPPAWEKGASRTRVGSNLFILLEQFSGSV